MNTDIQEIIKSRREIARNEKELVSILKKAIKFNKASINQVLDNIQAMLTRNTMSEAIDYIKYLQVNEKFCEIGYEFKEDNVVLSFFSKIEGTEQWYGVDLSIPVNDLDSKPQIHLAGIYNHFKSKAYNFYATHINDDFISALDLAVQMNTRVEYKDLLTNSGLSYNTMNILDDYLNYLNDGFDIYEELSKANKGEE